MGRLIVEVRPMVCLGCKKEGQGKVRQINLSGAGHESTVYSDPPDGWVRLEGDRADPIGVVTKRQFACCADCWASGPQFRPALVLDYKP